MTELPKDYTIQFKLDETNTWYFLNSKMMDLDEAKSEISNLRQSTKNNNKFRLVLIMEVEV